MVQKGYLVLSDISGYTSFMAGNELDHGQAIVKNIIDLLIGSLSPVLKLAEVEGDAVFFYADERDLNRGELLVEIIEKTYETFRDKKRNMVRNATCECKACRSLNELDLKFISHYGEFFLQEYSGQYKPVGSDVNLAHRLLKNKVAGSTGWKGYSLLTDACIDKMQIKGIDSHKEVEEYEHLGKINTSSINLEDRYKQLKDLQVVFLNRENAHVVLVRDFETSKEILWDWLNDTDKRLVWMVGSQWKVQKKPNGRVGKGAIYHCSNSKFTEHVLDYRPFDYVTSEFFKGWIKQMSTFHLSDIDGKVRLTVTCRFTGNLPEFLAKPFCRIISKRGLKMSECLSILDKSVKAYMKDRQLKSVA